MPRWQSAETGHFTDEEYQEYILQGVSRTFALTIPELPPRLHKTVGNAYLLCRITDTIEDVVSLTPGQKGEFSQQFIGVVAGEVPAERFSENLLPLISENIPEAEHDLIKNTPRVIRLTHSFSKAERRAMHRCVKIMAEGMSFFQANKNANGLKDLQHLDRYCYYVAGVVGEMLTDLFCEYSAGAANNKAKLMSLAVSFGQGLQMTNILKDIWEDYSRGACWLPRDLFQQHGFDLSELSSGKPSEAFSDTLGELIAIAHAHLRNALSYILLIPKEEEGIRRFCAWAVGMALLTLKKINNNRNYISGNEVKISRRSVKTTIIASNLALGSNIMPKLLFKITASGLPRPPKSLITMVN